MLGFLVFVPLVAAGTALAGPRGGTVDEVMIRVLACEGPTGKMDVYLPRSVAQGEARDGPRGPMRGYSALDPLAADADKTLEPVLVTVSSDRKFVIVDQVTRTVPPLAVPVGGGLLDVDRRLGPGAICSPFNVREQPGRLSGQRDPASVRPPIP